MIGIAKVNTNVSIDADVKQKAQKLFSDLGMDLSTAINIFLHQAVVENAIPFVITHESSKIRNMKANKKVPEKTEQSLKQSYDNLDRIFEDLLK